MNARERMLAIGVLVVVVLAGGGFLFHNLFLAPLEERKQSIVAMQQDIQKKEDRIHQIQADLPRLDRWRRLSLPKTIAAASRRKS